jgi:hypothetical protein
MTLWVCYYLCHCNYACGDYMRYSALLPLSSLLAATALMTGCNIADTASPIPTAGAQLRGTVHGGQQPVTGAHIYLFAAATSGYGAAANSLITVASAAGSDSLGNYVITDSTGSFTVTGDYTCTTGTQVYLLATQGNPGLPNNETNPNLALMTALGKCPASGSFAASIPAVSINEVTTIASVYALSGFMTDLTHVASSGTSLSNTGMANAFANVNNLVNIVTGAALATSPAGNGTVPQTEINTLANIIASCVDTVGASSTPCSTLFADAPNGSTQPSDTVTVALNIAQNPGKAIVPLYALSIPGPPFGPALTAVPNDFTIALSFTGGGLASPDSVAIDSSGNVWAADYSQSVNGISELSPTGAAISSSTAFTGGGLAGPQDVAIDESDNVWVPSFALGMSKFNGSSGAPISSSSGYTGGGLATAFQTAIDGSGNVWTINAPSYGHGTLVSKLNGSTGAAISGSSGYTGGGLSGTAGIAIDASGYVWVANATNNSISRLRVSNGIAVSTSPGYTGGGLAGSPQCIAIDGSGNVWTGNYNNSVSKMNGSTGAAISASSGYTGGGLNAPTGIAIDGSGNAWTANSNNTITEINGNSGSAISPGAGFIGGGLNAPQAIAIDGSGNAWVANFNGVTLTEFVGVAAPVVTPLSAGVANSTLGTRP